MAVPKLTPLMVGLVAGLGELVAPENVRLFTPVYAKEVFPLASCAVMVILCDAPAVWVALPVITNLVAVPPPIEIFELVPEAPPVAEAKVNVPVPAVPVKINLVVKLLTPFTKSKALFNLLVPDNPVIVPVKLVVTVTLLALASKLVTVLP
ncbi:hypothetical protein AQEC111735_11965 [Aquirufa ecclesiirivi]